MSRKRPPIILPTPFPADSQHGDLVDSVVLPDSGWGPLFHLGEAEARAQRSSQARWQQAQARELAVESWDETGYCTTLH